MILVFIMHIRYCALLHCTILFHVLCLCRKPISHTAVGISKKISRAKAQYIYDEDGIKYLDLRSNVHHGRI